jgi:hypothetical protein
LFFQPEQYFSLKKSANSVFSRLIIPAPAGSFSGGRQAVTQVRSGKDNG